MTVLAVPCSPIRRTAWGGGVRRGGHPGEKGLEGWTVWGGVVRRGGQSGEEALERDCTLIRGKGWLRIKRGTTWTAEFLFPSSE